MLHDIQIPLLNKDVLEQIFSIVYDTSYPTIQSLLLTSRLFYAITFPLLYRSIRIHMATDSFKEEIQSWLVDPEKSAIPKSIHHIYIDRMYYDHLGLGLKKQHRNDRSMKIIGDAPQQFNPGALWKNLKLPGPPRKERDMASEWSTIAALISQTTQLRSLTFSCPEAMPLVLLQSIHNYHTPIHLNITSWTRVSHEILHTDPAELALLGSPSLRFLQAIIYNPQCNPRDLRLPAFWRLVRSAPNLQSLMLDISRGGCVINNDTEAEKRKWKVLASEFERTTISHPNLPSSGIRNLKITTGVNLSQFNESELSRLTTLDCSWQDLPVQIIQSLTSLAHLTLQGIGSKDDSLMACSPLTSLRVVGWKKWVQLSMIFAHHGHSLRSLALHEFENTDLVNPRQVLSMDELHQIRDGIPYLEELSIDLNIPENPLPESSNDLSTFTHHDSVYDALSTFPSLRKLQLNFNLGISTYNKQTFNKPNRLVPLVDENFVKRVWTVVNFGLDRKVVVPLVPAMKELRVAQGEAQRRTGHGYPAGWVLWEQQKHHWFKATPSERDDERHEHDKIVIAEYRDAPDFADDVWRECRW